VRFLGGGGGKNKRPAKGRGWESLTGRMNGSDSEGDAVVSSSKKGTDGQTGSVRLTKKESEPREGFEWWKQSGRGQGRGDFGFISEN